MFERRNQHQGGDIFYSHYRTLVAKSCVQTMAANPHNKDMLAAGSYSGT